MRKPKQLQRLGTRLSHPLWAMLIAAIAAVGAIAQCGLMLDAAAEGARAGGTAAGSAAAPQRPPADRQPVAAVTRAMGSSERAHPN